MATNFSALDALVVDDNPHMRAVLRTMLESFGLTRIREAASAHEAAIALADRRADIILLDHIMPEKLGIEFLSEVRASSARGDCWLIMVSGYSDARFQEVAHAAGADACVTKPVRPEALLAALNRSD